MDRHKIEGREKHGQWEGGKWWPTKKQLMIGIIIQINSRYPHRWLWGGVNSMVNSDQRLIHRQRRMAAQ
jgi:hypothetical protein